MSATVLAFPAPRVPADDIARWHPSAELCNDLIDVLDRHGITPLHTGSNAALGWAFVELRDLVDAYRTAPARTPGGAS